MEEWHTESRLVWERFITLPGNPLEFDSDLIKFYDRKGREIGLWQSGCLSEMRGYRRVAVSTAHGYLVSTVYLGLGGLEAAFDMPPLFFETAIIGPDSIVPVVKYPSEEAALKGHDVLVLALRSGVPEYPELPPLVRGMICA